VKINKITYPLICLLLWIAGVWVIPLYIPGEPDLITQDLGGKHNKVAGPIVRNTLVIQEVTMKMDYLKGVEIELATWAKKNTNTNCLTIFDKNFRVIVKQEFASKSVIDNAFTSFRFKRERYIGAGQHFYVCISSPDGTVENNITAWTDTTNSWAKLYRSTEALTEIGKSIINPKSVLKGSLIIRTIEGEKNTYLTKLFFTGAILSILFLIIYLIKKTISISSENKRWDRFFVFGLFLWIAIPGLYFFTLEYKPPQVNKREKRQLTPKPSFHIDSISSFPPNYEKHLNDYFPGREFIIRLRSRLYYDIFFKSVFPDKIVLGKENWLFKPGERKVVEGKTVTEATSLKEIKDILHKRSALYRSKGIDLYIVLVPMKSDINRAWLPDYYSLTKNNIFTDEIAAALNADTSLKVIDTKPALLRSNVQGDVFYKTDFHLSEKGAILAYKEIMNRIKKDYPDLTILKDNDFSLRPSNVVSGNDAIELGLDGYLTENYYYYDFKNPRSKEVPKVGYPPPAGFGLTDYYEIVYENKNKNLPKVLVIRDSFFHLLVPMISESFSRSVFIWDKWQYGANLKIVENEKPDVVILEMYSSFLLNLKDYNN
jgi:hypothetical protein